MKQGTEYAITNFGNPIEKRCDQYKCHPNPNDCLYIEYQYGVWRLEDNIPQEVIEANNDFNYLVKKYKVTRVIKVGIKMLDKISNF